MYRIEPSGQVAIPPTVKPNAFGNQPSAHIIYSGVAAQHSPAIPLGAGPAYSNKHYAVSANSLTAYV